MSRVSNPDAATKAGSSKASVPSVFVLGNFVQACCWNLERLPLPGESLKARGVHIEPGGKGLNVAVFLQRLGVQVDTLIGCGHDSAGDGLMALLHEEGIATRHVHRFASMSGWGAGLIGANGENAISVCLGANLLLTERHVAMAYPAIESAQLVYGQFETSLDAVSAAFRHAHAHGITTVLSPSPWETPPDDVKLCAHTVVLNEVEAASLLDINLSQNLSANMSRAATVQNVVNRICPAMARFSHAWPATQRLIVTLGELGCVGFERPSTGGLPKAARAETSSGANLEADTAHRTPFRCWHVQAYPVQAVDTVGAGDAFASGYCAAVLAGHDFVTALTWGNACGARMASCAGVLDAPLAKTHLSGLLQEQAAPRHQRMIASASVAQT